jgi:phage-related protein
MASKLILAVTLLVFLTTGRAPGMRELRNPDAEAGHGRIVYVTKRTLA